MRNLRLQLVTAYDNFWLQLHEATLGRLADTIGLVTTVTVSVSCFFICIDAGYRRSC